MEFSQFQDLPEFEYGSKSYTPEKYGLSYNPEYEGSEICNLSQQLPRRNILFDEPIVTRDILESYAAILNINSKDKSDKQLAEEISRKAPCQWISNVYAWAKSSPYAEYLNRYVTDEMMAVLNRFREGSLTQNDLDLIKNVNLAVYQSPRSTQRFIVYRGIYGDPTQNLNPGQITTLNTPKSGTFSIKDIMQSYLNFGIEPPCCIAEILVPQNAILTYHPSEDQVIFPTGAQFYVLSGPLNRNYRVFDNYEDVMTYQLIYINTPETPQIINSVNPINAPEIPVDPNNVYTFLSLTDAYLLCYYRNLPFPYGNNPYTLLKESDIINPSFINKYRSGYIPLNNQIEIRSYLALRGFNTRSHSNYTLEQMREVLRLLKFI